LIQSATATLVLNSITLVLISMPSVDSPVPVSRVRFNAGVLSPARSDGPA
jgi:hypothetical protein